MRKKGHPRVILDESRPGGGVHRARRHTVPHGRRARGLTRRARELAGVRARRLDARTRPARVALRLRRANREVNNKALGGPGGFSSCARGCLAAHVHARRSARPRRRPRSPRARCGRATRTEARGGWSGRPTPALAAPRTVIRPATALTRRRRSRPRRRVARLAAPGPSSRARRARVLEQPARGTVAPGGDAERDAENAARRAANQWARLESDAARSRRMRAAAAADAADRRAVDAEAQASVWSEGRGRSGATSSARRANSRRCDASRTRRGGRRISSLTPRARGRRRRRRRRASACATRAPRRGRGVRRRGTARSGSEGGCAGARDAGERIKAAEKYTHELEPPRGGEGPIAREDETYATTTPARSRNSNGKSTRSRNVRRHRGAPASATTRARSLTSARRTRARARGGETHETPSPGAPASATTREAWSNSATNGCVRARGVQGGHRRARARTRRGAASRTSARRGGTPLCRRRFADVVAAREPERDEAREWSRRATPPSPSTSATSARRAGWEGARRGAGEAHARARPGAHDRGRAPGEAGVDAR